MNEDEVKHLSFVAAVCRRPTMYTLGGTFAEVVSFLEGFFSGEARAEARSTAAHNAWSNLTDRLRRDYGDGIDPGGWQEGFGALRRQSPDETTALERLATLYKELLAEAD